MKKNIYNVNITIQEYDDDGFWDIFTYTETSSSKTELKESLESIIINCKKYIRDRMK